MPKVSIIIPCFNLGEYIYETIESVLSQTFQNFEIIIINDGSTDQETNRIIDELNNSKFKIIKTSNQGPAKARNNGILQAQGDYILPLDADDLIAPAYLEKAVEILDGNENIGIVYCEAEFFGKVTGKWELPDYDFSKFLFDNVIFSSAFFRKSDWEQTQGYNSNMSLGWEDYDFWLSIIELKRDVYKIPETLFFYRKRHESRTISMTDEDIVESYVTIFKNHKKLYLDNIDCIFEHISAMKVDGKNLREEILRLKQKNFLSRLKNFKWQKFKRNFF